LLGGAPVSKKIMEQIQYFTTSFYESYGMTETMSHIAIKSLKRDNKIFQAIGNVYFTESDTALVIHAEELGIKELKTNDQVRLLNTTSFEWLGRTDFVINSAGKKFHPEILEKKLENQLPYRFFIHKQDDEKLGEMIILLVECEEDKSIVEDLKNINKNVFDKYEIPKKVFFVPLFEETFSGKINRLATYNKIKNEY
jgi:O-succinylbenzoic acid--CoA ligase